MKFRYLNCEIATSENTNRPEYITVDGALYTNEAGGKIHGGKTWAASPSGNVIFYATLDGKKSITIPQKKFIDAMSK